MFLIIRKYIDFYRTASEPYRFIVIFYTEINFCAFDGTAGIGSQCGTISHYIDPRSERNHPGIDRHYSIFPMIEVENKVDLVRTNSDRIKISAMAGENLDELKDEIVRVLKSTEAAALPMEPLE